MVIRPTAQNDLPELQEVFTLAIGDVYARRNLDPPAPPLEVFLSQQAHLLEHDAERCFVAGSGGRIEAFVAAWARGDSWFLASLFIRPDLQGAGLGRALLDRAWGGEFAHRRTLTDAIQPRSNGLYARRGLIPATPLLTLGGIPGRLVEPGLEPAQPTAEALRELDVAAYGFDRAVDHELWRRAAQLTLWTRDGEPIGYSYAFPGGRIGPVAGSDGAAAAAALVAELARVEREATVRIPGSATELVETAIAAGLRFGPAPGLLLLSTGTPPPTALAIGNYTLL